MSNQAVSELRDTKATCPKCRSKMEWHKAAAPRYDKDLKFYMGTVETDVLLCSNIKCRAVDIERIIK